MAIITKKKTSTAKKASGTSDLVYRGGASKSQNLPYKGESKSVTKLPITNSKKSLGATVTATNRKTGETTTTNKKLTPVTASKYHGSGTVAKKKIKKASATSSLPTVKKPAANNKKFYQYK